MSLSIVTINQGCKMAIVARPQQESFLMLIIHLLITQGGSSDVAHGRREGGRERIGREDKQLLLFFLLFLLRSGINQITVNELNHDKK